MRIIFVSLLALVAAGCVSKSDERAGTPEDGGRADAARRPDARRQPDAPEEEPDGPLPPDAAVRRDARPRPPDAPQMSDGPPPDACVPMNCAQRGATCGTTDDGCGGMLTCGTCMMPESCGGGGTPNMCGVNRSWPLWKMPDSATEHCTNGIDMDLPCATTGAMGLGGQDGNTRINTPAYTPTADVVTDTVTGLRWQRMPATHMSMMMTTPLFTLPDARAYCAALSLGGVTGWRLPSRIELVTIVDYGAHNPAVDQTIFPATGNTTYWTGSRFNNDADQGYIVDFTIGTVDSANGTTTHQVRCVK